MPFTIRPYRRFTVQCAVTYSRHVQWCPNNWGLINISGNSCFVVQV
jgi:hypothetical protein